MEGRDGSALSLAASLALAPAAPQHQLELVVAGAQPLVEAQPAGPALKVGQAHAGGCIVVLDALAQCRAAGDRVEHAAGMVGLGAHPGDDRRVFQVLEVAERVRDDGAEVVVGDGPGLAGVRRLGVDLGREGGQPEAYEDAQDAGHS